MDKNRVAGSVKEGKGVVKESAGKAIGDTNLIAAGKIDKAAGKVQNAVGELKGMLKE